MRHHISLDTLWSKMGSVQGWSITQHELEIMLRIKVRRHIIIVMVPYSPLFTRKSDTQYRSMSSDERGTRTSTTDYLIPYF